MKNEKPLLCMGCRFAGEKCERCKAEERMAKEIAGGFEVLT